MSINEIYRGFPQEIRKVSTEVRNTDLETASEDAKYKLAKKVGSVALKAVGLLMGALAAVSLGSVVATLGTPVAATHLFSAITFSVASHEAAMIGHNLYKSTQSSGLMNGARVCRQVFQDFWDGYPEPRQGASLFEIELPFLLSDTWICQSLYSLVR